MRHPETLGTYRRTGNVVIAMVLLLASALLTGTLTGTASAQTPPSATPVAAVVTDHDANSSPGRDVPLLERIPAWQVTGVIMLAGLIATIVLFLGVRFRGQEPA
jgi:hypothetical protein